MSHACYSSPFGRAVCDVCGEKGPEVRNPVPYAIENAAKSAGWWFRQHGLSDEFCVCPDCRARVSAKGDA